MTNEGFSRQLLCMNRQLRRLDDRLAPPKQTEASRLRAEWDREQVKLIEARRIRRGGEPSPFLPWVEPPGQKLTELETIKAILREPAKQISAQKKRCVAEAIS